MQLTIDLLKKTTFFLFLCFLIQELISLVCILISCVFLLDDNQSNVDRFSTDLLLEISNSFNAIFIAQLHNIQSDLILIANHSKIYNITEFDSNSKFIQSYTNRLIPHDKFKTHLAYTTYLNTDAIPTEDSYLLFEHLKNKYESMKPLDEAKHIDDLFNEIGLQHATYYSDNLPSTITNKHERSIYYILIILKSLAIRDLNMEILPNKYSIITKDFFALYPPNVMSFERGKGLNYLFYNNEVKSQCKTKYLPECLTYFKDIPLLNGKEYPNMVYFNHPVLMQNASIGQACIDLPFNEDPTDFQSVLCATFEYSHVKFNIELLNHSIDFALIDLHEIDDNKDIELIYLVDSVYNEIKASFSNIKFANYALKANQTHFSLFHLLYYHSFFEMNLENKEELIESVIKEYESNRDIILPKLKKYLSTIKDKDYIENTPFIFNMSHTYISYSRTQDGQFYHKDNDHYTDIFHYIITPIVLRTSNEKADTNRFVFFSFVVNRNEITIKKNDLYHLLAIKTVNYYLFGIFLILFIILIFYFTFELFINSLLYPITKYKEDLLVILNNIPAYMKWSSKAHGIPLNSNSNNKLNKDDLSTIESQALSWESNSDICQYKNEDTKRIEYIIVFLKRILLMKYSDDSKYESKADIYKESLNHLQKYPIEYIKCAFIVAINLFKSRKYSQAIDKLNDISSRLRNQIAKIAINEDVKLSSNLSAEYECYINEFSNLSGLLSPQAKMSFELNMMFQNCFYIIGLVDWVWFKEVKSKTKLKGLSFISGNDNKEPINKKDKRDLITNQLDYFLIDKGIKAFTNALEINRLMKSNLIKNIMINLMLSKCEYEREQYQKSNWYLQEAFVEVMDFNNYLINSSLQVTEKSIILINGLLLQCILYYFGKLLIKIRKYKSACEVFSQCLEISLFKIERIHSKCFIKLSKILKGGRCKNELKILKKINHRLNPDYFDASMKAMVIVSSIEFINCYDLIEELKDALMKYINKVFKEENDCFGYIEMGMSIGMGQYQSKVIDLCPSTKFTEEFQKRYETNQLFTIDSSFHSQLLSEGNNNGYSHSNSNNTMSKEKVGVSFKNNSESGGNSSTNNTYHGIVKAIAMLDEFNRKTHVEKYIFLFGLSKFIDFCESEHWLQIRYQLHQSNISLYVFCFENEIPDYHLQNIVSYLKKDNLIEGILFKVKSFKLIKKAFQNITPQGAKKVFRVCFNDVNNIY